jgi:hypothetical protein
MSKSELPIRLFTVEDANRMLPLVRAIARDWVELTDSVVERRERISRLTAGRNLSADDPYGQELRHSEAELEKDLKRLRGYVEELRQLGVEAKQGGLIDFPSMIDGRIVYLCWQPTEPEILYWHELDAGYAGRQPLTAGAAAGDDTGDEPMQA